MAFEMLMAQVVSRQLQSPTITALARAPRGAGGDHGQAVHAATQHLFADRVSPESGEYGADARGQSSFHADIARRLLTEGQSI